MASPAARIRASHLIGKLREMNLDTDEFVLFGSAPMLAHGLRDTVQDLDIVARGGVWRHVSETGEPAVGTRSGDQIWQFFDGKIQFSAGWISSGWDADALIDNAEVIDGIRFATLADVLRYKEELRRPKDSSDIEALREYLSTREPPRVAR